MRTLLETCIGSLLIAIFILNVGCKSNKNINSIKKENLKSSQMRVMTWNIWGKLNLEPRYTINNKTAQQRVIDILVDSKADIITMTETYGSAKTIAEALNFYYYTPSPSANLTIFSRYPLENFGNIEGLSPFSFINATVNLPNNRKVKVYNIWLTSGGRHIVEIKDRELSDEEFNNGDENRYEHIQELLQHKSFKDDLENKDKIPVIVAGDFNCVSHLDYIEQTKSKGLNFKRIIPNKTSLAMANIGFKDSYREVNPEITKETLGYTWTTVGLEYTYESGKGFVPVKTKPHPEPQYRNPYTRIDYIYYTGNMLNAISSKTIIHHKSNNKRSFPEFPSDHGAVLTTFRIK